MELKDSGARKQFSTGAVRDISEGKGRCDLLPLEVVDFLLRDYKHLEEDRKETVSPLPTVLESIELYLNTLNLSFLCKAISRFIDDAFCCDPYHAMMELSKHYEDGARKYSPNNWRLGIDLHCFIDSSVRHYLKWLRGDDDEPHDRAVLWNLVGAIWTQKNRPEMNDVLTVDLKQSNSSTSDMVERALKCLEDNGISADESGNILQALGYIMLDQELGHYIIAKGE